MSVVDRLLQAAREERVARLSRILAETITKHIQGLTLDSLRRELVGIVEAGDGRTEDIFVYVIALRGDHGEELVMGDANFVDDSSDEMAVGYLYGIILGEEPFGDDDGDGGVPLTVTSKKGVTAAAN